MWVPPFHTCCDVSLTLHSHPPPKKTPDRFKPFSEEQLAAWNRDGYLVIRGEDIWTSVGDIDNLTKWTEDISSWPETPGKWMMYYSNSVKDKTRLLHRVENFFDYHEGFNNRFNSESFLNLVSQLFGEPVTVCAFPERSAHAIFCTGHSLQGKDKL